MKSAHIAAIIAAAALGCAIPAWAVGPSEEAPDPTVKGHANQTHEGTAATPSTGTPNQGRTPSGKNASGKHPPTSIMNRAMPPEKSTEEGQAASKHPPSRAMERALPDQKAPDSSGPQKPDSKG